MKTKQIMKEYCENIIQYLMSRFEDQRALGKTLMEGDMGVKDQVMALGDEMFGELSQLSETHWMDFHSITMLDLRNNGLETMPNGIEYCFSLKAFYLSNNITIFPDYVEGLSHSNWSLPIINKNRLAELPDSVWRLKSLEVLDIQDNGLTILSDSICNLVSLRGLFLDGNKLTSLPDSIVRLDSLEWLYLSDNQFETEPEVIGVLRKRGCDVRI